MQQGAVEVHAMGASPDQMRELLKGLGEPRVPDHDTDAGDDDGGDENETMFVVQLVLDRPYRNDVEGHALTHALIGMEGMSDRPALMAIVLGNPLTPDSDPGVLRTFIVLAATAISAEEVLRQVTETVTETVPAPFGITAVRISAIARKDQA
jgi:hypothetical protein